MIGFATEFHSEPRLHLYTISSRSVNHFMVTGCYAWTSSGEVFGRGRGNRWGQAIGNFREAGQTLCQLPGQRSGLVAPAETAGGDAGSIQAGFAAQTKDILQRDHRQTGDRTLRQADQAPVNAIGAGSDVGSNGMALGLAHADSHQPSVVSLSCVPV